MCDSYLVEGAVTTEFPYQYGASYQPQYKPYKGWEVSGVPSFHDLPSELLGFMAEIETFTSAPIHMVSLGPDRTETVLKKK